MYKRQDSDEAQAVANKLVDTVRLPMQVAGIEIFVTTSIGVAIDTAEEIDAAALIEKADRALYQAKAAGRNTFALENNL